jgi:hypothetical protein
MSKDNFVPLEKGRISLLRDALLKYGDFGLKKSRSAERLREVIITP